jgi:hypothetical protein
MTGKRKRYSAEFKAKVALEALRGELTTAQLATKHGVHQTMISEWKRQVVDGLSSVFSGRQKRRKSPGKERWRSCTRKSGSWWWSGIFCRRRPGDERGAAAGDDRSDPPASVGGSAMRVGFNRPLGLLSCVDAGDGGEPAADASA